MGYCHVRSYQLRYTELDFKDELKLSALLGLIQEAACTSADELGFGYDALKPHNFGFITVSTYCELLKPIRLGDAVTVETWPLPPRHVFFERDYRVKNGNGEVVANAASRWCLVDLSNFSLLTPDALGQTHKNCPYNPEKAVESAGKLPRLGEEAREVYRLTVGNSRYDHYLHANNTFYADFFCDCFTMEELKRPVRAFQISYVKQAKEGEELAFYRKDCGNESFCEARCGGEVVTSFRIRFGEN